MFNHIFDFDDGEFAFQTSENMAIDSGGDILLRVSDNMAMDLDTGDLHFTSAWEDEEEEEDKDDDF